MKKTLKLSREVLKQLTDAETKVVVGGSEPVSLGTPKGTWSGG